MESDGRAPRLSLSYFGEPMDSGRRQPVKRSLDTLTEKWFSSNQDTVDANTQLRTEGEKDYFRPRRS